MGVIKLDYVIRYSSQDYVFKAENLLHNTGSRPWLCSQQDHSGHLEAEFQLDRASSIHFIDIGNFGSSTIEVQVGRASFQQSTNYVSFLPASTLLTLKDMKAGADTHSVHMFDKNDICKSTIEEQWDRVKIICCQPYQKKTQFGLAFLSLRSKEGCTKELLDANNNLYSISDMPPLDIPRHVSCHAESSGSKDKWLVKTSTNAHIVRLVKPVKKQFKEDVKIFLIVCEMEDERQRSVQDYQKEFEHQYQRKLTTTEKAFFQDKYKVFNEKKKISETSQNTSDLIVENGFMKLTNSSLSSSPTSHVDKPNCTVVKDKPYNPLKRSINVSLSDLVASFSKKQRSNSSETVQKEKNMDNKISASSGIQVLEKQSNREKDSETTIDSEIGFTSDSSVLKDVKKKSSEQEEVLKDVKKKSNEQEDSVIQSKIGFTRPEDFIQPDGMQPSTSSGITYGITYVECPICREYFMSSEIEKHASTCGDFHY